MSETSFTPPKEELEVVIPQPLLWRILVRPLQARKVTVGGILMTDKIQQDQEFVTVVGQIVAMGDKAFKDAKFSDDNNPGIGSWVLYPTYGGQRIELSDGRVYQLMNDDSVLCVVDDPELYRKKLV